MVNEASDGFTGVAPLGCFAPNRNGLYEMVGNVWEVRQDYFRQGRDPGLGASNVGFRLAYDQAPEA